MLDFAPGRHTAQAAAARRTVLAIPCLFVGAWLAGAFITTASAQPSPAPTLALPDVQISDHAPDDDVVSIDTEAYRARAIELSDLLDQHAGLQVRRTGGFGSFTTVSIRGASSQQTSVLLNGLPLAPTVVGGFNFGALSLKDLSGVDIYAGRAPVDLAQGAPGGVINLRSDLDGDGWATSGYASYGSAATWQTGMRTGLTTGPVTHGVSLGTAASDNDYSFVNPNRAFDPNDPDRQQEEPRRNADVDRQQGLYVAQWTINPDWTLGALAQHSRQSQGLPDARNSVAARTRLTSRQTNVQMRVGTTPGRRREHQVRGYWHRTRLDYDDRQDQLGVGAQLTHSIQDRWGMALIHARPLGTHWNWRARLEPSRETYTATNQVDGRTTAGRRDHLDIAGRLGWRSSRDRWRAGITLRHQRADDRYEAGNNHREGSSQSTRPQLDLGWQATAQLRLYAHAGAHVRLPTFFERYGDRGLFIGNADLAAEQGRNLNLGLRWRQAGWSAQLEAYASELNDAIVTQYDVLSGIGRAENVAGATVRGIELSSRWSGSLGWLGTTLQARAALQDTENTTDGVLAGKQLPGRFSEKVFIGTTLWLPGRYELFHEWIHVGGVFYDSLNSRPAPDQHEHTVGLRRPFVLAGSTLDAGIEIRNLTDERAEEFNAQPRPGRQFFASVEWTLHHRTTQGSHP